MFLLPPTVLVLVLDKIDKDIEHAESPQASQLSGFKSAIVKRAKHDQANADARRLISNTPSTKTSNWNQLNETLQYMFRNFNVIKEFYTTGLKKLNSTKYQQSSPDIRQTNEQKWKPLSPRDNPDDATRPTVVAFGSAMFGGLRRTVTSPTKAFRKSILRSIKAG
ncbi:hypothetical protein BDB01DRAFT_904142 [Pilobolus umbonatus]|nr:hypothetical protein BDB01DRAFT_904142 [Pilobolus umbonatus]